MNKIIKSTDQNFVEIEGYIKAETEKAILFFDGSNDTWIPKSQIEDINSGKDPRECTIVIPEWLAVDKELC